MALERAWSLRSSAPSGSLHEARAALTTLAPTGDAHWEARLLEAAALSRLGRRSEAIPKLQEARAVFDVRGVHHMRALCDLALGMAFLRDGETQAALEATAAAEGTLRELGHPERSVALQHLALVLHALGESDLAKRRFDEAAGLDFIDARQRLALMVNRALCAVDRRQWGEAEDDLAQARSLLATVDGADHERLRAHVEAVALKLALGTQDHEAALRCAETLSPLTDRIDLPARTDALVTMAEWWMTRRPPDVQSARGALQQGLGLAKRNGHPIEEERICLQLAELERGERDLEACLHWRDKAAEIRERRHQRTLRRRLEAAQLLHELSQVKSDVERMTEERASLHRELSRLEARAERQAAIINELGHDIRSPLTVVTMTCGMLLEFGAGEHEEDLREMWRAGLQIRDLLDALAGPEAAAGSRAWRAEPLPLRPALELAVARWQARGSAKGQQVTLQTCEDLIVDADPTALNQVLDNLIGNAVKFTPRAGRVTVACTQVGDAAELLVDDDGPGISAADRELVFKRFVRGTQRPTAGESSTGVGLALVRHLVERHGGTVEALRSGMGGARLRVRLPIAAG